MVATSVALEQADVAAPIDDAGDIGPGRVRRVWQVSLCLLSLQLIGMVIFSTAQYRRFNLTSDFAGYAQGWAAIAHGHMSPYSSIFGVPLWRDDLELVMWPLALLYWIYPHSVMLLWLQDLAVVGGELVALAWVGEALTRRGRDHSDSALVLGMTTALLVLTPWSWFTIGFDFHLEPIAVVFALLAAWDLWAGRYRRLLLWAPLTLACCAAAGALMIIAIGLAAAVSRDSCRRVALALVVAGGAWLALVSGLDAMRFGGLQRGLQLSTMYGYLLSQPTSGLGLSGILEALVLHPLRAVHMFASHVVFVIGYVASAGVVGLRSRWGLAPAAFVLVPSALNADSDFIHFGQAFQSWPAVLFLVVGSALALQSLAWRAASPRQVVLVFGSLALTSSLIVMVLYVGHLPTYIERVSPAAASELANAQRKIPGNAEIIASQGVIGRLAPGHTAYDYWAHGAPERYAINGRPVAFVLAPMQGTAEGLPHETLQAVHYVRDDLHATVLEQGAGIWVFEWQPKPMNKLLVLP
jgi:Predicted membrane protein (DUF2079)